VILKSPPARQLRRQRMQWKRGAIGLLIFSVIGLALWETFTGPHPQDFGYRFSPMYCMTWQGFGFWTWVGAVAVSIALINYLWLGREEKIHCPHCHHDTSSKDNWMCPSCNQENRPRYGGVKDSFYTPLTRCIHCGAVPTAYQCPHCKQIIALDTDADLSRYAYQKPAP
jgi:hypothetical protein